MCKMADFETQHLPNLISSKIRMTGHLCNLHIVKNKQVSMISTHSVEVTEFFLSLRFYVKSILVVHEVENLQSFMFLEALQIDFT